LLQISLLIVLKKAGVRRLALLPDFFCHSGDSSDTIFLLAKREEEELPLTSCTFKQILILPVFFPASFFVSFFSH